ncbi:hypothetical protein H9657_06130 [Cellulomonas sp. Sa3CUA2]|uniref:Htaa domain-containing protein n=1 Tax=Cellulomonas avistercoris TaxID=2762242 RepID=A0ABR8QBR1_9CELL|nr:hypothetical protein [Cellulomonas avistercoris]MBD7917856.1 hypothetical protein [Cellulomonas avistercoris]
MPPDTPSPGDAPAPTAPADLTHLPGATQAAAVLALPQWSWGIGPLRVDVAADLGVPRLSVTATLAGWPVGSAVLDPQHTETRLGGGALGFSARLDLTASFTDETLTVAGELVTFSAQRFSHTFAWADIQPGS